MTVVSNVSIFSELTNFADLVKYEYDEYEFKQL